MESDEVESLKEQLVIAAEKIVQLNATVDQLTKMES